MEEKIILNIKKPEEYIGKLWHYGHFIHDFIVPVITHLNNTKKFNHIYLLTNKPWSTLGTFLQMAEKILGLKITEIIPEDVKLLYYKVHTVKTLGFGPYKPKFFKHINSYIKNTLNITESFYKVILIERGKTKLKNNIKDTGFNRRHLDNHNKLKRALEKRFGPIFKNVILENLTIDEQVSLFTNAKIVIGQHGAGLCNIVWMNTSNSLVIEFPPYIVNTFKNMCKVKDYKYFRIDPNPQTVVQLCLRHMPKIKEIKNNQSYSAPVLTESSPYYELINNIGVINSIPLKCTLGYIMFMLATGYTLAKSNNLIFYKINQIDNNYNENIFKHIGKEVSIDLNELELHSYKRINSSKLNNDLDIDDFTNGIILNGFYQNYTYIKKYEKEISDLFLNGLAPNIVKISERYVTTNTAFLHIAYDHLQGQKIFKQPDINYYKVCIDKLLETNKKNKKFLNKFFISIILAIASNVIAYGIGKLIPTIAEIIK
jgi:hypothetical protein